MYEEIIFFPLNLCMFADGGAAAGDGGGAGSSAGDPSAEPTESGVQTPDAGGRRRGKAKPDPFANVEFGIDERPPASPAPSPQEEGSEKKATFDELIRGEYKQDFDNRVQDIVGKRVKNLKAAEEQLGELKPMLELLAKNHDIQPGKDGSVDVKALIKAVMDDDNLFEREAAERGMSVDTYKLVHKLETEAKQREEQDKIAFEEQQRRASFERLVRQSEEAKKVYPGFDLSREIQNPDFVRLTANGVDAKTAYMVIHKDEIMSAATQQAAQAAAKKVSNSVAANAKRPVENGLGGSAPATTRLTDPTKFTKAQRAELRKRVARGDKIVF